MQIRFRSMAALVALLTLSLFWAESIWASMCPPDMEMGGPAAVMGEMGQPEGSCPMGAPTPERSDDGPSKAPHCPFVPAGASSCTVGVPFVANVRLADAPSGEHALLLASSDHAKDLLLAIALFHPPRA